MQYFKEMLLDLKKKQQKKKLEVFIVSDSATPRVSHEHTSTELSNAFRVECVHNRVQHVH